MFEIMYIVGLKNWFWMGFYSPTTKDTSWYLNNIYFSYIVSKLFLDRDSLKLCGQMRSIYFINIKQCEEKFSMSICWQYVMI
jgi:hypothetical protein